MDLISGFGASAAAYILPFLFVLTIVVFFHELGHFMVARWCGVAVETFSIGFGREIFGWTDRLGTRWKVGWLPLGGYVKFVGDENEASAPSSERLKRMSPEEKARSFHAKPVAHRAAVVAAGPIANFLLAIVLFAGIFFWVGERVTPAYVDEVQSGSAAEQAGFKPGDRVLAIDGDEIGSFGDMQRIVSLSPGRELAVTVRREGAELTLLATPELKEVTDNFGNVHQIGILGIKRDVSPDQVETVTYGPIGAVWMGTKETWFVITRTLDYLGQIIVGTQDADQLGGPLRIAQVSGQVATFGFVALLNLTAILSVSIGLMNLFPVPMLDGGHLLYFGIEAVRGKPLDDQSQQMGFRVGLALVMMLMLFATWNDLVHLRVVEFLSGLLS